MKLQVQSRFNPVLDINNIEYEFHLGVEIAKIIAIVLRDRSKPFQDINGELDKWYSGISGNKKERVFNVLRNPKAEDDSTIIELGFFRDPEKEKTLRISFSGKNVSEIFEDRTRLKIEAMSPDGSGDVLDFELRDKEVDLVAGNEEGEKTNALGDIILDDKRVQDGTDDPGEEKVSIRKDIAKNKGIIKLIYIPADKVAIFPWLQKMFGAFGYSDVYRYVIGPLIETSFLSVLFYCLSVHGALIPFIFGAMHAERLSLRNIIRQALSGHMVLGFFLSPASFQMFFSIDPVLSILCAFAMHACVNRTYLSVAGACKALAGKMESLLRRGFIRKICGSFSWRTGRPEFRRVVIAIFVFFLCSFGCPVRAQEQTQSSVNAGGQGVVAKQEAQYRVEAVEMYRRIIHASIPERANRDIRAVVMKILDKRISPVGRKYYLKVLFRVVSSMEANTAARKLSAGEILGIIRILPGTEQVRAIEELKNEILSLDQERFKRGYYINLILLRDMILSSEISHLSRENSIRALLEMSLKVSEKKEDKYLERTLHAVLSECGETLDILLSDLKSIDRYKTQIEDVLISYTYKAGREERKKDLYAIFRDTLACPVLRAMVLGAIERNNLEGVIVMKILREGVKSGNGMISERSKNIFSGRIGKVINSYRQRRMSASDAINLVSFGIGNEDLERRFNLSGFITVLIEDTDDMKFLTGFQGRTSNKYLEDRIKVRVRSIKFRNLKRTILEYSTEIREYAKKHPSEIISLFLLLFFWRALKKQQKLRKKISSEIKGFDGDDASFKASIERLFNERSPLCVKMLIRVVNNKKASIRVRSGAIDALALKGIVRAVPVLMGALKEEPLKLRVQHALFTMNKADMLLTLLNEKKYREVHRSIAEVLLNLDVRDCEVIPYYVKFLRHEREDFRKKAKKLLIAFGTYADKSLEEALRKQEDADLQKEVISVLSGRKDREAVELLIRALKYGESVARSAESVLAAHGGTALEPLVVALRDPGLRGEAEKVLVEAARKNEDLIVELIKELDEEDIRPSIKNILRKAGPVVRIKLIRYIPAISEKNREEKIQAEKFLREISESDDDIDILVDSFREEERIRKEAEKDLLAKGTGIAARLVNRLRDRSVAAQLKGILVRMGSPAAPVLVEALADDAIREDIEDILLDIGREAVGFLIGSLSLPVLGKYAKKILLRVEGLPVKSLVERLSDADRKEQIKEILYGIGKPAEAALIEALSYPEVREAAEEVLLKINAGIGDVSLVMINALKVNEDLMREAKAGLIARGKYLAGEQRKGFIRALAGSLDSGDCRKEVVEILKDSGEDDIGLLADIIEEDGSVSVQSGIIEVLSGKGSKPAAAAILTAWNKTGDALKLEAGKALRGMPAEVKRDLVEDLEADKYSGLRSDIIEVLMEAGIIDERLIPYYTESLKAERIRPEAEKILISIAGRDDALGDLSRQRLLTMLEENELLSSNADISLKDSILRVLLQIGRLRDVRFAPWMIDLLRSDKELIKKRAKGILAAFGSGVTQELVKALADKEIKEEVESILLSIGTGAADALVTALKNGYEEEHKEHIRKLLCDLAKNDSFIKAKLLDEWISYAVSGSKEKDILREGVLDKLSGGGIIGGDLSGIEKVLLSYRSDEEILAAIKNAIRNKCTKEEIWLLIKKEVWPALAPDGEKTVLYLENKTEKEETAHFLAERLFERVRWTGRKFDLDLFSELILSYSGLAKEFIPRLIREGLKYDDSIFRIYEKAGEYLKSGASREAKKNSRYAFYYLAYGWMKEGMDIDKVYMNSMVALSCNDGLRKQEFLASFMQEIFRAWNMEKSSSRKEEILEWAEKVLKQFRGAAESFYPEECGWSEGRIDFYIRHNVIEWDAPDKKSARWKYIWTDEETLRRQCNVVDASLNRDIFPVWRIKRDERNSATLWGMIIKEYKGGYSSAYRKVSGAVNYAIDNGTFVENCYSLDIGWFKRFSFWGDEMTDDLSSIIAGRISNRPEGRAEEGKVMVERFRSMEFIKRLESQRILFDYGEYIKWRGDYEEGDLVEKLRAGSFSKDEIEHVLSLWRKPLAVLLYPRSDWNGGFMKTLLADFLSNGYRVMYYEVGDIDQWKKALKNATGQGQKASVLVIAGHGSRSSIQLDNDDTISLGDKSRLRDEGFDECMEDEGIVLLQSCSTGLGEDEDNMVNMFCYDVFKNARVVGPQEDCWIHSIEFEEDKRFKEVNYAVSKEVDAVFRNIWGQEWTGKMNQLYGVKRYYAYPSTVSGIVKATADKNVHWKSLKRALDNFLEKAMVGEEIPAALRVVLRNFLTYAHSCGVRKITARILGYTADESLIGDLEAVIKEDTENDVRSAAVEAVGRIGGNRAIDVLKHSIYDGYGNVPEAAASVLADIAIRNKSDSSLVADMLSFLFRVEKERSSSCRIAVIDGLGRIAEATRNEALREKLLDGVFGEVVRSGRDKDKVLRVVDFMSRMRSERAAMLLIDLLPNMDQEIKCSAAQALYAVSPVIKDEAIRSRVAGECLSRLGADTEEGEGRECLIGVLGEFADKRAVPLIINKLKSQGAFIKSISVKALGDIAKKNMDDSDVIKEITQILIDQTNRGVSRIKREGLLVSCAINMLSALEIILLRTEDAGLIDQIIGFLGKIESAELVRLKRKAEEILAQAERLGTAAIKESPAEFNEIKEALCDKHWIVRRKALEAIINLNIELGQEVQELIGDVLRGDKNFMVRMKAVETLKKLHDKAMIPGGQSVVPGLIYAMNDPVLRIRKEAISILSVLKPVEAMPGLFKLLNDENKDISQAARDLIYELKVPGDEDILQILEFLKSKDENTRRIAIDVLENAGPKAWSAVPSLLKMLSDRSGYETTSGIKKILYGIGAPEKELVPDILEVLRHTSSNDVKCAAVEILGKMEGKAKCAIPELIKMLAKNEDLIVKNKAHVALEKIGAAEENILKELTELAGADCWELRHKAEMMLCDLKEKAQGAVPVLIGNLKRGYLVELGSPYFALTSIGVKIEHIDLLVSVLKEARHMEGVRFSAELLRKVFMETEEENARNRIIKSLEGVTCQYAEVSGDIQKILNELKGAASGPGKAGQIGTRFKDAELIGMNDKELTVSAANCETGGRERFSLEILRRGPPIAVKEIVESAREPHRTLVEKIFDLYPGNEKIQYVIYRNDSGKKLFLKDQFGFSFTKHKVIALLEKVAHNPSGVFHEYGHFLTGNPDDPWRVRLEALSDNTIAVYSRIDRAESFSELGKVHLTRPDAVEILKRDKRDVHYVLRALQREIFGDLDVRLTEIIMNEKTREIAGFIERNRAANRQLSMRLKSGIIKEGAGEDMKRAPAVDMTIELPIFSGIPKEAMDINIELLAEKILEYINDENINFVFEKRMNIFEGMDMPEYFEKRISEAPEAGDVLNALRKCIVAKAGSIDVNQVKLDNLIKNRIKQTRTVAGDGMESPVEIPIVQLDMLEWANNNRIELCKNQYPVAMYGISKDPAGRFALWNFDAAITIGMAKARLVIARRGMEHNKERGAKEEFEKLKDNLLKKIAALYRVVREGVTISEQTIEYMLDNNPAQRMNRAIELFLPPITRLSTESLKELYKNCDIFA
ncbi:MAG: HEAT repeat domain-containing protein [Candidatus Omnitrophota bacterium]